MSAKNLIHFINSSQLTVMLDLTRGEEGQHWKDKIQEYSQRIEAMPKTYEQDGLGSEAIAYLHYFKGGADWYITEKDVETADEPGQHQAFGLCDLGYGRELGYISIVELISNGVELDLNWTPCTIGDIQTKQEAA